MLVQEPHVIQMIKEKAKELDFTMSCDQETGILLRALACSKSSSNLLELGTGVGASTSWILEGMDASSTLTSVEMNESFQGIARSCIQDERVNFILADGCIFIQENRDQQYDLIFADTWPGKYELLEETLQMVKPGGLYIIDDLTPVDTWEEGHAVKAENLVQVMRNLNDFHIVELNWSTGLIIATRKSSGIMI
ncbi:class I SAM-dependent methyltransferase [Paenibacillus sp. N1-5-1-14]|uniref:O-methyltransferase n=1 Tax=Paenibacillus radicibacter TaxID=2972488 RepID=UPI002159027C|nr:class I SAM-dependent methyltransferase [Paenibacillus radicibacter]MCR8644418.1 class I SAM-dependent methyltransferase [Paenibacillus radicibacter]